MKQFVTAVEEAFQADEEKGVEFDVDGVLCRCYQPRDGQVAVLMASTGRHASQQEKIAGIVNFFVGVLDDESHQYITTRLMDGKDPFGIKEIQAIMEWMVEMWSGNPTQSRSGVTGSPKSDGQKSTPPTLTLT